MTSQQKLEQRQQLAALWGCDQEDLIGLPFRGLLEQADRRADVLVFWGCWTDEQLNETL